MFRKKPPQLSLLEELRQTYDDCCNFSIKNLALEENNHVEDALKGWKGLHTSLLYKIDLFDRSAHKLSNDEIQILTELKAIRDQNVKHLIRVQLRMDEVNRKKSRDATNAVHAASKQASSSSSSSLSVPSLRNPASRSLSSNSVNQRSMLKSLRPGMVSGSSSQGSSSSYNVPKVKTAQASQAANVSWQGPQNRHKPSQKSAKELTETENELFDDFDDDGFEFTDNWERINDNNLNNVNNNTNNNNNHNGSRSSSGLSELSSGRGSSSSNVNLIDLDDDNCNYGTSYNNNNTNLNSNNNGINGNLKQIQDYFSTSPEDDLVRSMDDITLKPHASPTRQHQSLSVPKVTLTNHSSGSINKTSATNGTTTNRRVDHISKSTSDIRTNHAPQTKQPYIYNKPKPIDVSKIMKKQSQNRLNPTKSPTKQPTTVKSQPSKTAAAQRTTRTSNNSHTAKPKTNPSSNISYNYVKTSKTVNPAVKKTVKPATLQPNKIMTNQKNKSSDAINSPTMDDLLSGYDNDEVDVNLLTNEEEQEALINSVRGVDPDAAKHILNDIVIHGDEVYWDDLVGLESAKYSLKEAVVYPFLRPDLFKGLREPTRGMLLFGPPGTGKTMLARAVATESKSTFFSISASSLTSKYLGESEKLVRALFLMAKKLAPSIVFVDEIDSLLSSRTEGEVESTRRIKNEFLVQWSELSSAAAGRESDNDDVSRVLILGATNLPWSIDEAARRRFARRQYIPLPEADSRSAQIRKLLQYQKNTLSDEDYEVLKDLTDGFSGSDITALAKDSAMGPLRALGEKLLSTPTEQIRPINLEDFKNSLKYIRPSVSSEGLQEYEKWAEKFGSSGA
ncbi:hypothetical protein G9P44_002113 [Scheffersomyces stipitis]|nr:hypothetical protein G9P44_002113 [Scheffersomyces stipitis]